MKPQHYSDLYSGMDNNPLSFKFEDVEEILSQVDGENDGASWHWLLRLKDGSHKYVYGGCDYTGWDCRSSLNEIDVPDVNNLDLTIEGHDYSNRPIREIFANRKFVDVHGAEYTPEEIK